jgi:hypothetical protein
MSVLTKEEVSLLNKLADSQPALNKPGLPLGESQVKLGDALEQAAGASAKKFKWSMAAQGDNGNAPIKLGTIPAGAIVTSVVIDKLGSTVDTTDASLALDGADFLANEDLSALADLSTPAILLKKASAGVVTLELVVSPTEGEMEITVAYTGA